MSSLIDLVTIPAQLDGRRKITDAQKEQVKYLHRIEGKSIHSIAKTVGISKRSVQFILFPERLKVVQARAIEVKRWEAHNGAAERRVVMRKHRAKKKALINAGLVKITPDILTKYQSKLKINAINNKKARQRKHVI